MTRAPARSNVHHVAVIGVAHERMSAQFQGFVDLVQEHIGKQRR